MRVKLDEDDDDEDKDDEIIRRERFPNPHYVLSPELAPGFTMEKSEVFRHFYRKKERPNDTIYETWVKGPLAGFTDSTFIRIALYPLKDKAQALKTARRFFLATTDKRQYLTVLTKPNPGSFSGQPIGDYCWAFVVSIISLANPMARSTTARPFW